MRYVVVGAHGMLGSDLVQVLQGREVVAFSHRELDITDIQSVSSAINSDDVVFNCAAFTRVDDAELHETEAFEINAIGVQNLAQICNKTNSRLFTISSDYVFSGNSKTPYSEKTPTAPISAYGRSKAAGEKLAIASHPKGAFIVRSAWMYGEHGANFAQTMLNLASQKDNWEVVNDQFGQPTWSMDLAHKLVELTDSNTPAGIFHATNTGETTWFDFAREVLSEAGLDPERITPTDSASFSRPAPRPAYSVLGQAHWKDVGLAPMRNWKSALKDAFKTGIFK